MDATLVQTLETCLYALCTDQASLRRHHRGMKTSEYRFEKTWHEHALLRKWVPTIGGWGQVWTPDVLMQLAKATPEDIKAFRHRYSLTTPRLRNPREKNPELRSWRTVDQWVVAYGAYLRWCQRGPKETPESVARDLGILPAELRIYVECISSLLVAQDVSAHLEELEEIEEYLKAFPSEGWLPYSELIYDLTSSYTRKT